MRNRRLRWGLIYAGWILVCVVLFLAFRGREDPSRRGDRILSTAAATRAIAILRQKDPVTFSRFEAVHVAYSDKGEDGPRRWVVLCDEVPHTALQRAVVVELDAKSGALLGVRKPV